MGLTYAENVADGIRINTGVHIFNNCVFSSNDGFDGVKSAEGDVPFDGNGCVGDDWINYRSLNNLTFSHCTITGAFDKAVIINIINAVNDTVVRFDEGTCIANNGGTAIEGFRNKLALVLDGTSERVLIADNGKRSSVYSGFGVQSSWDAGVTMSINKTDLVNNTGSGIGDFAGVKSISISDSRIALNNGGWGNLYINDTNTNSGSVVQPVTLAHVTIHDGISATNSKGISVFAGANQPSQSFTITDSIFSGTGDEFNTMTNPTNSLSSVNISNCAVVTVGPHTLANTGQLGTAQLADDPQYASLAFTIGRGKENTAFLQPTASSYLNAGTGGSKLTGGAPPSSSGIADFMLY